MKILSIIALAFVFALPVLVCAYPILREVLGAQLDWSSLTWDKLDWSKFNGSQLANAYTPILAFFTLIFLVRQQDTSEQIIVVQQQREDLTYLLDLLDQYLKETKIEGGKSVYEWFKHDVAMYSEEKLQDHIKQFDEIHEKGLEIITTWYAIWKLLNEVNGTKVFKKHTNMCEAKVISKLSFHVCVALDKFFILKSLRDDVKREHLHFIPRK